MRNKFQGHSEPGYHPIRKIRVALRGLYYAVVFDFAVTYKLALSLLLLMVFFYYRQWLDFGLILVATGVMLVAEIFNTAIESICDFVESKYNPKIGIIKDMSAAAAGISIFVWCLVVLIESFRVYSIFMGHSSPSF